MSISIEIRRLKGQKNRSALDLMLQEAFQRGQQAMAEKAGQLEAAIVLRLTQREPAAGAWHEQVRIVHEVARPLAGAVPYTCPTCGNDMQGTCEDEWHYMRVKAGAVEPPQEKP